MLGRLLLLLILSSCALFKGAEKIKTSDTQKLLASVKTTGEGKGRLHIRQRQYLFGVESVLKDDGDWIMAVSIPLQGEEALIFPSLQETSVADPALESFAARIDAGIRENFKGSVLSGKEFLDALRSTLRFLLSERLKLPVSCTQLSCTMQGEEFTIERDEKSLRIITAFSEHQLITTASNLTGSFFLHTQFRVVSPSQKEDLLSLELFWSE